MRSLSRREGRRNAGIDFELYEDDFIAAELVGADPMIWRGVADPVGLRFGGDEIEPAIVFGIAEHLRDEIE